MNNKFLAKWNTLTACVFLPISEAGWLKVAVWPLLPNISKRIITRITGGSKPIEKNVFSFKSLVIKFMLSQNPAGE